MLKKVSKTVGLLRKFQNITPRTFLITIYKSFAGPHLDYGDIMYDQAFNETITIIYFKNAIYYSFNKF